MSTSGKVGIPLCSFCFKSTSSSTTDDSDDEEDNHHHSQQKRKKDDKELIKNFIELVQSYFGKPLKNVGGGGHQLSTCQDCRFVIKDFSSNCAKLLEVEEKVKKRIELMKNVMSSAEKVKSRVTTFNSYARKDKKSSVMITGFRKDFIEKCVQHYSKPPEAPPQILVKYEPPSPSTSSSPLSPLLLKSKFFDNLPTEQRNNMFHSLISTFIVLLLGMSGGGGGSGDGARLQLDDFSNDLDDCLITYAGPRPQPPCDFINLEGNSSDNDTVVLPRSSPQRKASSEGDKKKREKVKRKDVHDSIAGMKRKAVDTHSEDENGKRNGGGSDSDSESQSESSSSNEEGEEEDEEDPDFDIIRISRKKKRIHECDKCGQTFKGKGKNKRLENHQLRCASSTPKRSRKRGGGGRSESSSPSPSPLSKQRRGRGRPRKKMRKNVREEEDSFMSSRGGGRIGSSDGSSPWQMNLMRVIGSLHK